MPETRVPVLIVGGGTVGLTTALFLAHHGVPALVVESQAGPSIHPRATGLGPRTMEILRQAGLQEAVNAVAVDMTAGALGKISATTLASASSSMPPRGGPTRTGSGAGQASPGVIRGVCPQHRLDSVLLPAARERGATVRYSARLRSLRQDADGVTAVLDGHENVRADYLVAADGVRSDVRTALGVGTSGPGVLGDPKVNILFRADLSPYTHGRSFATCDITNPDSPGMLMTVDGAKEWIFHVGYTPDAGQTAEDFTPERCRYLIRAAVGDPSLDVEVLSTLPWRPRGLLADRFRAGRVFLVGDAAHVVPPLGAFGLNTGIADAHNLAWKLAAVLAGHAGPALLDSYEAERRPTAAFALEQALRRLADPWLHWEDGPRAVAAREAAGVVNAPVVHLGYRYDSVAVIDPRLEPPSTENVELALDGAPGSRLPHVWVEQDGRRISTLDLVRSRFTLLTGSGGDPWTRAAREAADRLGVELAVCTIAPGAAITDPEGRWPGSAGIAEDGALLVRPDQFVAWRVPALPAAPADDLTRVLTQVLARDGRTVAGGTKGTAEPDPRAARP
ncbi:FAD-dependent monooxygenase [Microtetraspora malaysiensis]|uniref:FAD-dependent monooxygenase n=1 Tax=Microtetraspora malaysiensis TaxID=161358 RepID=UPI000831BCD2|nr:FAD-dependent monooxygenase [Microtetraspora malaysiensis]